MKARMAILAGLILGVLLAPAPGATLAPKRVILISIDGLRNLEALEDAQRTHVPHLDTLTMWGTTYSNFQNQGATWTTPGHNTILTGARELRPNSGTALIAPSQYSYACSGRPLSPTIFELLREAKGWPESSTRAAVGKSNVQLVGYSLGPSVRMVVPGSGLAPGFPEQDGSGRDHPGHRMDGQLPASPERYYPIPVRAPR